MSKDHDFVVEFIESYKTSPCLWNKTDARYHNANIREAAYTLLLKKYQEYDKKATKAMVKSKINSLRSTYNKELKKVKDSERSGAGTGEVYKPSLWYYDLLSFVSDQQPTVTSVNTMDDEDENQEAEDSQSISDKDRDDDECSVQGKSSDQEFTIPTPSPSSGSNRSMGSKRSAGSKKNEFPSNKKVLQLVAERLKKTDDIPVGKHDSFGKHVADELNNMLPEMVPYVKKIINLAIFEGHMKTLNAFSSIVTQRVADQPQSHLSTPQPSQNYFSTPLSTPGHFSTSQPSQTSLQPMQGQFSTNISPPEIQGNHASVADYFSQFADK